MDYRTLIREKRQEKGLSQGKLAQLVQVSQPFIAEIESGRKKPSVDVLMRICAVLDISLFGQEET
ncbi:helix-turn-helix domain-containing protein [uncultured Flavonifractor sp.]|uniref:helix-turn-helix domain-containing protein n=1 Tax=uncultured Flavonifractor sp. TaxID=1193534 RepID=UPI00262D39D4|nr:helix-turn-helix transcriptional regulator [uncultured Flavonifractor sp.]